MKNEKLKLVLGCCALIVIVFLSFKFGSKKETIFENNVPVSVSLADSKFNCYDHEEIYRIPGNGTCLMSPDGKLIFFESDKGLKLIEVATGKITPLSESKDDRGGVWFSDSKRILGFSGSFPEFECDGPIDPALCKIPDNRKLIIWNVESRESEENIGVDTPKLSVGIDWLVPDHTAKITTIAMDGTEGDHYFFNLDLDHKTIVPSGDYHWRPK